jgi:NAD(P)H-dependent FMN reductase
MAAKILAFAGSLRAGSFNKMLARLGVEACRAAGAETTYLDLRDYPLPVFDEDLEAAQGMPEAARRLKEQFLAHDGLLLSCPEYNSSITAALKNAIDWVSRKGPGPLQTWAFTGKVAALLSASPGALGGLRGLVTVRSILSNIDILVMPKVLAVPRAFEAFTAEGKLKDAKQQETLETICRALVATVTRLKG